MHLRFLQIWWPVLRLRQLLQDSQLILVKHGGQTPQRRRFLRALWAVLSVPSSIESFWPLGTRVGGFIAQIRPKNRTLCWQTRHFKARSQKTSGSDAERASHNTNYPRIRCIARVWRRGRRRNAIRRRTQNLTGEFLLGRCSEDERTSKALARCVCARVSRRPVSFRVNLSSSVFVIVKQSPLATHAIRDKTIHTNDARALPASYYELCCAHTRPSTASHAAC